MGYPKRLFFTEEFDVTTGVLLQGDVLAPFLFIITIDYTMKMAEGEHGFITIPRRSTRYPKEVINDLDFADDIALLENRLSSKHKPSSMPQLRKPRRSV